MPKSAEAEFSESDCWVAGQLLEQLTFLEGQIASVLVRIEQATADDPLVAKLKALYGVGIIIAVTLRTKVGRFDRFDTGKQLARFCGVTPRQQQHTASPTPA